MWGYFAAGIAAGLVAAWQWSTNVSRAPSPIPGPSPGSMGPGALIPRTMPSQSDIAATEAWAAGFIPYRMDLSSKLRLIARQMGGIGWPDYAQRVGAWYGLI